MKKIEVMKMPELKVVRIKADLPKAVSEYVDEFENILLPIQTLLACKDISKELVWMTVESHIRFGCWLALKYPDLVRVEPMKKEERNSLVNACYG
jgi:hypothetical protein